jgi:hypothetical protein
MPHNYTVNFKGEKQVAMKTTSYEKLHVSYAVYNRKWQKLPPYVILKRKTVSIEHF